MKDNDGDDLMFLHSLFIDKVKLKSHTITGFTRFEAEGFWFDNDVIYKDKIKIYEFHVSNSLLNYVYDFLRTEAVTLCRSMKQECIYLQLNNDTELVKKYG
jgi:hypothetical protein